MKKIQINKPGSYNQLKIVTAPDLEPGPTDVLVNVQFVGVNYADCVIRMGLYESAKEYVGYPITPGFEVSGVISMVGSQVQGFKPGDQVIAVTRFDGYATQVCVPESQIFLKPPELSMAEAAGFPTVFLTAWYGLVELAHPRKGAKILVHSAGGGVGSSLVQIGKAIGCHVVGVVGSSHKVDLVKKLGADKVIDKSKQNLWPEARAFSPEGYKVILDANGVETLGKSYKHLSPTGKLVIYGFHTMLPRIGGTPNWPRLAVDYLRTPRFNPIDMTNDNKSVLAFNLSYLFNENELLHEAMNLFFKWLHEKKIQAPPVTVYPFDDVAKAHAALESGKTQGKLVLRVKEGVGETNS